MTSTSTVRQSANMHEDEYFVTGPGARVKIPVELFYIIKKWNERKKSGRVQLEFLSGGIAGVEATERLK